MATVLAQLKSQATQHATKVKPSSHQQAHARLLPPLLHRQRGWEVHVAGVCLLGLATGAALLLPLPPPAAASIPLEPAASSAQEQRALALRQLGARYAAQQAAPQPEAEPASVRIQQLQQLMAEGNAAAAGGDYASALGAYDVIIQKFGGEFATVEYARLARAEMLYQLGRVSDAILQLEDLEVTLRGYAEVHAALASILYVERPALLEVAEQQWEIALEFQPRFSDRDWVQQTKHWPPRLMAALDRFLKLQ